MNFPVMYAHLLARGLDPLKYRVAIDEIGLSATFLLWNRLRQLVGLQRYTPWKKKQGKFHNDLQYFTWVIKPHHSIWGWEYVRQDAETLFITEGIFDAVKIINAGYSAIAMLGNAGSPAVKQYLEALPYKRIAICDDDEAGKSLAKVGHLWYNVPGFKDLGEMPQAAASKWISEL
jgi:hypothetical protein